MNINYRKIFFIQTQKVLVLAVRNSRRDNFRTDTMHVNKIVNNASDIFTELYLIEKKKSGLREIDAELNLHERHKLITVFKLFHA